jgi:hypothetical protein
MSTETHKSTVDKPLGHKDIRRAMSYAHVLRRGSLGLEVYRPLDFSVVTPFGIELISKLSRSRLSRRLGGPTARAGRVLGIGLSIHLAHFRLNLSPIIPPSTTQGGDYRHPGALPRIKPDSAAPALLPGHHHAAPQNSQRSQTYEPCSSSFLSSASTAGLSKGMSC